MLSASLITQLPALKLQSVHTYIKCQNVGNVLLFNSRSKLNHERIWVSGSRNLCGRKRILDCEDIVSSESTALATTWRVLWAECSRREDARSARGHSTYRGLVTGRAYVLLTLNRQINQILC